VRRRVIDGVLAVVAVVGAVWLGYLIYHNHFGGHVERAEPALENVGDTPAIGALPAIGSDGRL